MVPPSWLQLALLVASSLDPILSMELPGLSGFTEGVTSKASGSGSRSGSGESKPLISTPEPSTASLVRPVRANSPPSTPYRPTATDTLLGDAAYARDAARPIQRRRPKRSSNLLGPSRQGLSPVTPPTALSRTSSPDEGEAASALERANPIRPLSMATAAPSLRAAEPRAKLPSSGSPVKSPIGLGKSPPPKLHLPLTSKSLGAFEAASDVAKAKKRPSTSSSSSTPPSKVRKLTELPASVVSMRTSAAGPGTGKGKRSQPPLVREESSSGSEEEDSPRTKRRKALEKAAQGASRWKAKASQSQSAPAMVDPPVVPRRRLSRAAPLERPDTTTTATTPQKEPSRWHKIYFSSDGPKKPQRRTGETSSGLPSVNNEMEEARSGGKEEGEAFRDGASAHTPLSLPPRSPAVGGAEPLPLRSREGSPSRTSTPLRASSSHHSSLHSHDTEKQPSSHASSQGPTATEVQQSQSISSARSASHSGAPSVNSSPSRHSLEEQQHTSPLRSIFDLNEPQTEHHLPDLNASPERLQSPRRSPSNRLGFDLNEAYHGSP